MKFVWARFVIWEGTSENIISEPRRLHLPLELGGSQVVRSKAVSKEGTSGNIIRDLYQLHLPVKPGGSKVVRSKADKSG